MSAFASYATPAENPTVFTFSDFAWREIFLSIYANLLPEAERAV